MPRRYPTTRYVAVLEGEGPGTSRTVLATADPETVRRVVRVISEEIEGSDRAPTPGPEPEEGRGDR